MTKFVTISSGNFSGSLPAVSNEKPVSVKFCDNKLTTGAFSKLGKA